MATLFLTHLYKNGEYFFIFKAKIYKNIINYFIRKLVNDYEVVAKPLVFTDNN